MDENITDELGRMASGIPKKRQHVVPKDYFEELPDRVLKRWDAQQPAMLSFTVRIRNMISAAAMVSGVCLAVALYTQIGNNSSSFGQITSAEAYEYIITHIEEFEPWIEIPLSEAVPDDFQKITPESLEEYLLEEYTGSDVELIF